MPPRNNRRIITFFAVAALAIILLASGLTGLQLDAGRNFAGQSPRASLVIPDAGLDSRFFLILYVALLVMAVLALFLSPEDRRRILIALALIGVFVLLMYRFIDQLAFQLPPPTPTAMSGAQPTPLSLEPAPTSIPFTDETEPVDTPEWLVTAIGLMLALMLTGVLALVYLAISRRKASQTLSKILAEEAEQAVADIRDGDEIRDVILRCYSQMMRHLEESRNLHRGIAVTPHEFEFMLVRLGFPPVPIQTLTSLFEAVRYGHQNTNSEQIQQAIDSLQAIVNYVGEAGGK